MGWKGTMRSISAAARRMEKDAQRRHKQAVKDQVTADAADAVENWEQYINDLLTVHTNLAEHIDWERLLIKPQPKEPVFKPHHQNKAKAALSAFRPSMLGFLGGGNSKRSRALNETLAQSPLRDEADYKLAMKNYATELSEWEADGSLAKRLIDGESSAIQEVISEMQTLSKNDLVGSSMQFSIADNYVHAKPQVHTDAIVPNYRRKQLASGKLSETKMPTGQFNELYQDYVASVALKVASDLFQILPLGEVYVTCESTMLNSATGHKEAAPILSVQFVRETMMQLRLSDIDPSDSMGNFNHVMKFTKTKGFSPITPLGDDT